MGINTSATSACGAPAFILEQIRLVYKAAPESRADPAAFLVALVRQQEATRGSAGCDATGGHALIAAVEKNELREDLLKELLQYVSIHDALFGQPLQNFSGAAGGNGASETKEIDEYSEWETLTVEALLEEVATLSLSSANSSELGDSTGRERIASEGTWNRSAGKDLGNGQSVLAQDICGTNGLGIASPARQVDDGTVGMDGRGTWISCQSQHEGGGLIGAGMSSFGTARSEPKTPDTFERIAGESLFSQFDQKPAALTNVSAEGLRAPFEVELPAAGAPLTTPRSVVSAGDSVPVLDNPLNLARWHEALGERILWMTDKGLQAAEIKLNPAHLGPLEIRIQMDQDQASIHFATHHGAVREAIEAAVPKLREMLGAREIALNDINVSVPSGTSDEKGTSFDFSHQPGFAGWNRPRPEQAPGKSEQVPTESGRVVAGNGLVNLYV